MPTIKICLVNGCKEKGKYNHQNGMVCKKHYNRLRVGISMDAPYNHKNGVCEIEGCTNKARTKGLCSHHYSRLRNNGDANYKTKIELNEGKPCNVEDCNEPTHAKGLCNTHYRRFFKHGDPLIIHPNSVKHIKRLTCLQCGSTISQGFGRTEFCSYKCVNRWNNKQSDERVCIICGKEFQWTNNSKTCSDECGEEHAYQSKKQWNDEQRETNPNYQRLRAGAQRRRRSLILNTQVEQFKDIDIYERDGWKCGLCGKSVNQKLKYPDKKSATIDHIIPLSVGGTHEARNIQLAHLQCNRCKGNRPANDQLILF